ALLAGNVPAEGDLQPDEMGILPAVPLPLLGVRFDVAGPLANLAVHIEANKFEIAVMVKTFPISNSKPPAPARRAEADGSGRCHLNSSFFRQSFGLFSPLFATGFRQCPPRATWRRRRCGACGGGVALPLQ